MFLWLVEIVIEIRIVIVRAIPPIDFNTDSENDVRENENSTLTCYFWNRFSGHRGKIVTCRDGQKSRTKAEIGIVIGICWWNMKTDSDFNKKNLKSESLLKSLSESVGLIPPSGQLNSSARRMLLMLVSHWDNKFTFQSPFNGVNAWQDEGERLSLSRSNI